MEIWVSRRWNIMKFSILQRDVQLTLFPLQKDNHKKLDVAWSHCFRLICNHFHYLILSFSFLVCYSPSKCEEIVVILVDWLCRIKCQSERGNNNEMRWKKGKSWRIKRTKNREVWYIYIQGLLWMQKCKMEKLVLLEQIQRGA
jgi:hypothetical protein